MRHCMQHHAHTHMLRATCVRRRRTHDTMGGSYVRTEPESTSKQVRFRDSYLVDRLTSCPSSIFVTVPVLVFFAFLLLADMKERRMYTKVNRNTRLETTAIMACMYAYVRTSTTTRAGWNGAPSRQGIHFVSLVSKYVESNCALFPSSHRNTRVCPHTRG